MSKLSKIVQTIKNCQKLSKLSKLLKIVENCQKMSKNVQNCQNVDQVMFPYHSDQVSQRSQVSRVFVCQVVKSSVTQWVTRSPIELFWTAKNICQMITTFHGCPQTMIWNENDCTIMATLRTCTGALRVTRLKMNSGNLLPTVWWNATDGEVSFQNHHHLHHHCFHRYLHHHHHQY